MPSAALKLAPVNHQAPIFSIETIAQCRTGVERLMEAHGREFTYHKLAKGPVSPKWSFAMSLENQGRLQFVIARAEGNVVGYWCMVTDESKHYDIRLCLDDTFYLAPEYRNGWGLYKFVKFAVTRMAEMGGPGACLIVADKVRSDLEPIWRRLGFEPEEIRWTKMVSV